MPKSINVHIPIFTERPIHPTDYLTFLNHIFMIFCVRITVTPQNPTSNQIPDIHLAVSVVYDTF